MPTSLAAELENYCFMRHCSNDLLKARQRLDLVAKQPDREVKGALLESAIVVYARPFSGNRGKHKKKYRLTRSYVPKDLRALHKELIDLRNEYFAHTDVGRQDSKVMNHGPMFMMTLKVPDFASLCSRDAEVAKLFQEVESRINTRLEAIEAGPWMKKAREDGKLERTLSLTISLAGRGPGNSMTPVVIDLGPPKSVGSSAADVRDSNPRL